MTQIDLLKGVAWGFKFQVYGLSGQRFKVQGLGCTPNHVGFSSGEEPTSAIFRPSSHTMVPNAAHE